MFVVVLIELPIRLRERTSAGEAEDGLLCRTGNSISLVDTTQNAFKSMHKHQSSFFSRYLGLFVVRVAQKREK